MTDAPHPSDPSPRTSETVCAVCGNPILWRSLGGFRWIAVDRDPDPNGTVVFEQTDDGTTLARVLDAGDTSRFPLLRFRAHPPFDRTPR